MGWPYRVMIWAVRAYTGQFLFPPPIFLFSLAHKKISKNTFRSFFSVNFNKIYAKKFRKRFPKFFRTHWEVGRETVPILVNKRKLLFRL
jgi:hypothetical protein